MQTLPIKKKWFDMIKSSEKKEENQELKKQLEDKLDKWDYENTMQQKEFINYLEDLIKKHETAVATSKLLIDFYKEILQKYKSIIGVSDEKEN